MGKAAKRARQKAQRAERREREARLQRRAQLFKTGRRVALVVVLVIAAGVIITQLTGSDDEPEPTTSAAGPATTAPQGTDTTAPPDTEATTTTSAATDAGELSAAYLGYRDLPTACGAQAPDPLSPMSFSGPQDQAVDGAVQVRLVTSCGDIVMELDPEIAPESVNSFLFLAREGYYDGTVSHRIVPGFVVQFGDPTATGTGDAGYKLPDEFPDEGFAYDRGVVAMAKASAPDTTGTQFFIAFADTGLFAGFNPLGRVVEGFEVLDLIETVPVSGETPLESVYLEQVIVES